MEKQDILEKSRREKTDEGVTYAENAGRREGKYLWVVVCGAIASLCFLLCYVLRTW